MLYSNMNAIDITPKVFRSTVQKPSTTRRTSTLSLYDLADRRPVALNPIRAGIAETPETSDYTCIKKRIAVAGEGTIPRELARFQGNEIKCRKPHPIPFALKDYVELVEWMRPARLVERFTQQSEGT